MNHSLRIATCSIATLLLFVGAGCTPVSKKDTPPLANDSSMIQEETNTEAMIEEPSVMEQETMIKEDTATQPTDESMLMEKKDETSMKETSVGSYEAYAPEKISLAADGQVVLFFHAPWCPSCKKVDSDIIQNSSTIPAELTILKTDYDTSVELRKKYGVTYQHTFVHVDATGNMIKKWSGSNSLEDIIQQVK